MIKEIAPYVTILTAIVAAYLTYRNQLRLKTFELLIERRKSVLTDIEKYIENLYAARFDIDKGEDTSASKKYAREYFHEGMMLTHKIIGANFSPAIATLNRTFWTLITEPTKNNSPMSKEQFKDWINRTTNVISLMYGMAHSELTKELDSMATPWISRKLREYKDRKK
ncbi:hypothetical protein ABZR34_26105 [Pseudomonas paraeruginosa]|uniref:DUF4760 domain-containing protein n=1 Tax=Pseudomonas aeruginosa TaxID=287 RepID=A0ABD7K013_PSEAI|nr:MULTISPECIES: hypothetical protein [Pseudomonas aeruginosa group]MBX6222238.1 hypothetical protein [Pseudomonas aeruginosa]RTR94158.1 hypothetical protein DY932_22640 [Pseudomonas paraeruginosa]RTS42794.1 hypothetical protein DY940_22545 [Pseudomonas aeruginosa]